MPGTGFGNGLGLGTPRWFHTGVTPAGGLAIVTDGGDYIVTDGGDWIVTDP